MSFTSEQSKKQNCTSTIQFPTFLFFFFFRIALQFEFPMLESNFFLELLYNLNFLCWNQIWRLRRKKSFLLKDTFQGLKVKTGGGKKNHSRSWIMCWEGFNTSTGTSIHWLIDWFIYLLITSFVHQLILLFTDSFIRFTESFINPSIYLSSYLSSDDIFRFFTLYLFIHSFISTLFCKRHVKKLIF